MLLSGKKKYQVPLSLLEKPFRPRSCSPVLGINHSNSISGLSPKRDCGTKRVHTPRSLHPLCFYIYLLFGNGALLVGFEITTKCVGQYYKVFLRRRSEVCVFFAFNHLFYPSTSCTDSARADSSILERYKLCGHKPTPQRYYSLMQ